jgi:hypothetical protein
MRTKLTYLVVGCLLAAECVLLSGCADLAENALYDQDVRYYQSRGVNHQEAEHAAAEDWMGNGQ